MGICSDDGKIHHYISHYQQSRFIKPDRFEENDEDIEIENYQKALSSLDSTSIEDLRLDLKKQKSNDCQRAILTKTLRKQWAKWSDISYHYWPFRGSDLESASRLGSFRSLLAILVTITPQPNGITFEKEWDKWSKRKRESGKDKTDTYKRNKTYDRALNLDMPSEYYPGGETIASVEPAANEIIWPARGVTEILK